MSEPGVGLLGYRRFRSSRGSVFFLALSAGLCFAFVGSALADKSEDSALVIPLSSLEKEGQWTESGLRLEQRGSTLRVAADSLPAEGEPEGLALPDHLGGGYLFYQPAGIDGSSATDFYRAESWTGELFPLARVPYEVLRVEAGFDRLYLLGTSLRTAMDPRSGEVLPLDPLPPLVTVSELVFDGPQRALVQGPLVGVLYTEDSGLTWRGIPEARKIWRNMFWPGLYVTTAEGTKKFLPGGLLSPSGGAGSLFGAESSLHAQLSLSLGRGLRSTMSTRLLELALKKGRHTEKSGGHELVGSGELERELLSLVTRGLVHQGISFAIDRGFLLRLHRGTKISVERHPLSISPGQSCLGIGFEEEIPELRAPSKPLFVCKGKHTEVFAFHGLAPASSRAGEPSTGESIVPEKILTPLWRSSSSASLLAYGDGVLLFSGSCKPQNKKERPLDPSLCLVDGKGAHPIRSWAVSREARAAHRSGLPHAFAVSRSGVWMIWVDRKESLVKGRRLWASKSRSSESDDRRQWKIPNDKTLGSFLRVGSLLPRASLQGDTLLVWAVERERLVGIHLGDGKEPSFGAVQRPLSRALIDGPRALLWGAAGFAKQSLDGGMHFEELSLPYRNGDSEPSSAMPKSAMLQMGCSKVGCALGRLLRLGWRRPVVTAQERPKAMQLLPMGPSRFHYECSGSGRQSQPRLGSIDSNFPSFWETPSPHLSQGAEGVSASFPQDLARIYAWGPKEGSWSREGRVQVRFIDPWAPVAMLQSTPTPQSFATLAEAQAALGALDTGSAFHAVAFDSGGRGGVAVVRTKTSTEIAVFSEGEPIQWYQGAHELGIRNLVSALRARGQWFAAFEQGSELTVFRLTAGEFHQIAHLPVGDSGQRSLRLVRTRSGDLGVSMEGDSGLFVYPLDVQGELGEPVFVPHQATKPEVCAPEASGFVVDRAMSVAPYFQGDDDGPMSLSNVRARWIVGHGAPCIEAMTASSRAPLRVPDRSDEKITVPLAVLNADSRGSRALLECY